MLPMTAQYLAKIFFPINLNVQYPITAYDSWSDPMVLAGVGATGTFLILFAVVLRKNRMAAFGLFLFLLTLAPTLYKVKSSTHSFSDRYLYLPMAGFLIFFFLETVRLGIVGRIGRAGFLGIIAILVIFSAGSISRNTVWRDHITLWKDSVEKSPREPVPRSNLALAYFREGKTEDAAREFEISIELNPEMPSVHSNLALANEKLGNYQEALRGYETAIRLEPGLSDAHYNLGILYGKLGNSKKAYAEIKKAMELSSKYGMEMKEKK